MGKYEDERDKKIHEQNKKIVHYLYTIFWSMVTALITCYLMTH